VCALDLPILADWLSVSNLNLKSEQRDVSLKIRAHNFLLQQKEKGNARNKNKTCKEKKSETCFFFLVHFCVFVSVQKHKEKR